MHIVLDSCFYCVLCNVTCLLLETFAVVSGETAAMIPL